MVIVSFKLKMLENHSAFCSASESDKQKPGERTLDLPIFFCYKYINSLKNHLSIAQGESLPHCFGAILAAVFGCVCFDLQVESIPFASNSRIWGICCADKNCKKRLLM